MTAGRRFQAWCGRCFQVVECETTGFPYGPLAVPLQHNRADGEPCLEQPVLFAKTVVELEPMKMPKGAIFDVESQYGKKP